MDKRCEQVKALPGLRLPLPAHLCRCSLREWVFLTNLHCVCTIKCAIGRRSTIKLLDNFTRPVI